MPAYVSLFRWTDDGIRSVKDTVARTRESIAAIEKAGGKMTVLWTQGRYDLVAIGELPNEDAAMGAGELERILKKVV
ncbi:MAG: GYD domain-containing protein [Spirochaetia bacterium]